jgi:hypothetical protein
MNRVFQDVFKETFGDWGPDMAFIPLDESLPQVGQKPNFSPTVPARDLTVM